MAAYWLRDGAAAILDLLAWRTRVATEGQLKLFSALKPRSLRRLLVHGLLHRQDLVVCLPELFVPLFAWMPGEDKPDCAALCWRLEQRRKQLRPRRERVFWASAQAQKLMGGGGAGLRQPMQVEHDLGTTAIYLRYWQEDPEIAQKWLGEDLYRLLHRPKGKVPDAVYCNPDGVVQKAIEFAGAYSAARLAAFHRHCARLFIPYELW